jgi:hypothetical protein
LSISRGIHVSDLALRLRRALAGLAPQAALRNASSERREHIRIVAEVRALERRLAPAGARGEPRDPSESVRRAS